MTTLLTIGFTKSTAEAFFERLRAAGVRRVLDTRTHRDGQLSGFAKAVDLRYFLHELVGIEYRVADLLSPEPELLRQYRQRRIDWPTFASAYRAGLERRDVASAFSPESLDGACLFCSEHAPERCHRSIAAAYLAARVVPAPTIAHL